MCLDECRCVRGVGRCVQGDHVTSFMSLVGSSQLTAQVSSTRHPATLASRAGGNMNVKDNVEYLEEKK